MIDLRGPSPLLDLLVHLGADLLDALPELHNSAIDIAADLGQV